MMMMLVIMAIIRQTLKTNDDNDGVDLQSRLELQRTMEERNVGRSRWSTKVYKLYLGQCW